MMRHLHSNCTETSCVKPIPRGAGYDVKVASIRGGVVPFDPLSLTAGVENRSIVERFFQDGAPKALNTDFLRMKRVAVISTEIEVSPVI